MVSRPGWRIVCLREVQKSISNSVHQLLADTIQRLGVGALFEIQRDQIIGPGGSLAIFRGMQDHTAESIKSLEGFDCAWFEEAQACSQRSLDILRPTLRKAASEIWFTWNPRRRTDPVDVFLRQETPHNAIVVRANWSDNPWFPRELEEERELDRAGDAARYAHIWEGDYEATSDQQLIAGRVVREAMDADAPLIHAHDETILGVDVARYGADETVIAVRRGRDAAVIPWEVLKGLDTMEVAARVVRHIHAHRPDAVFVDETGVGAGVVDRLRQLGHDIVPVNFGAKASGLTTAKAANKRAEMWLRMRDWLEQGGVRLPDDHQLEAQLTAVEYKHDANNAILLEKKEDMRKRGLPSPDKADALALTFAYPVMRKGYDDADDYGEEPQGLGVMGY